MSPAETAGRAVRVVAVSPHLDDAAFSAGGLLAGLAAAGAEVHVVTVFTATVPGPTGFALACQTDKGLPPEVDYMALRRAEDAAATAALGVRGRHLPLAEAPHRGYGSPAALFGPVAPGDEDGPDVVRAALAEVLDGFPGPVDLLLGPQALGDHVDHRHVRAAVDALTHDRGLPLARWADTPYVLRPGADAPAGSPRYPTGEELDAKVEACAAYATQLGFQFDGPAAMTRALRALPETFDPPLPVRAAGPHAGD
ncbi:PIG-L family deacetylase [Kineococcus radiotolerans]|uniref:LmbE family protein n=1 Tax=Kineococcus radiotolerans (strain ATCC BAA-149 / DSM 14245 / SRS30216) TaxID=266940 RepID=A6WDK0_KINRD|nr:PIG-L family deacetylase [Kineococcus radiotolerans]ABS04889.1 LmbE family protein [Kineococcus radiotolerans SRS30216 = ATCC BAA-149]